jgi:hypothetical protein
VLDIADIATHWGKTPASPGWNNRYDRDRDVDIVDIMLVAARFGEGC